MWIDAENGKNRPEAVKIIASPKYVGADEKVLLASMTGKFSFAEGDTRDTPEFNLFFNQQAAYPFYSDGIWYLTQMRRWGQIAEAKPDQWYLDTVKAAYRPDLYTTAAQVAGRRRQGHRRGLPGHRRLPRLYPQGNRRDCLRCQEARRLCREFRHRAEARPDRHARRRQVRNQAMTAAPLRNDDFAMTAKVEPPADVAAASAAAAPPSRNRRLAQADPDRC